VQEIEMSGRLVAGKWKQFWIIVIIAVASATAAAQDLETKLAQRADWIPSATNVREQLIQVAQHYKIPMGIEWVIKPEEKEVKLVVGGAPTVMSLLNLILQATPNYSLTVGRGIVHVSDNRYTVDSRNFLNMRIGEFKLTKTNVYDAEAELRLKIRMTLHPERYVGGWNGGYGSGPREENDLNLQNISFSGKNLTVRDILDRIVSANGNTLWVVNIAPTNMMANEPFFAQSDAKQETGVFWKIIPFNPSVQQ
jgi:hypothetical protein